MHRTLAAGAALAVLAVPVALTVAPSSAEAPASRSEARLAAASAAVAAQQAHVGPRTEVEAMQAAAAAAPSMRSAIADARAEALRERYTPAYARDYAQRYMRKHYGWGDGEFQALVQLWTRESNWDYTATNPTSGAYGIPQSLPASKMASEGDDWRTSPEPQIRWGLRYIRDTYGSPSATVAFWNANGWY